MYDRNFYKDLENFADELNEVKRQYKEKFGVNINPYDYRFQYLDSFIYYAKQSIETGYLIENFLAPIRCI